MMILAAALAVSGFQNGELRRLLVDMEADTLTSIASAQLTMRVDPECYGVCETCGASISPQELDVVPWTQHCARHRELPSC